MRITLAGLWITPDDLGDDLAESEYAVEAVEAASHLLWSLSGRKFSGLATITERYSVNLPELDLLTLKTLMETTSTTVGLTEVSRSDRNTIRLKGRPVVSINAIRKVSNGEILDPMSYHLQDHSTIVFRDLLREEVEINYTYGQKPPASGKMAARALAQQFAMLWGGREDECTLPDRVTSVTRLNMNWVLLDNQDFLEEGRTGIYTVDLFLKSVNPDNARNRAKVFSPDLPRGRRVTPKYAKYPSSGNDLLVNSSSGTVSIELSDIDASFLDVVPGWEPEVIIRNWTSSKSTTLLPENVVIDDGIITITVRYEDALPVIGMNDPGSWDLYAVNGPTIQYIDSGNLKIKLG